MKETAQVFASVVLLTFGIVLIPSTQETVFAQTLGAGSTASAAEKHTSSGPKLSKAQKIALAMSAGPAEISQERDDCRYDRNERRGRRKNCVRARTDGCATPRSASRCAWIKNGKSGLPLG